MVDRMKPGGEPVEQAEGDAVAAIYSSHPSSRFKLGRFQFERGVLKLNAKDAAELDALLEKQPIPIRNKVKKSTQEDAERIAASFLRSRAIQGIDTTANSMAPPGGEGSTLNPERMDPPHHQPGASVNKETDGSSEPERGPVNDSQDPFDGDAERRAEVNMDKDMPLQAVGGTTGSSLDATGESVAAEETAKNEATPPVAETTEGQEKQAASGQTKPLFGIKSADKDADQNGDDQKAN